MYIYVIPGVINIFVDNLNNKFKKQIIKTFSYYFLK